MKKDVIITIQGLQRIDGDLDRIELTTCGQYYRKSDSYFLSYEESETTGYEGCHTTLQIDAKNTVTLRRTGKDHSSHLVIEKGSRHQCHYDMGLGSLTVGVSGESVSSTLSDTGGELDFTYSMDIDTALTSENRVIISVKECES